MSIRGAQERVYDHPQAGQEVLNCAVCGRGVVRGNGRCPRQYHDACRRFKNFLDAAGRQLDEIRFTNEASSVNARQLMRGEIMALLNRVQPASRHELRGSDGKFARREG